MRAFLAGIFLQPAVNCRINASCGASLGVSGGHFPVSGDTTPHGGQALAVLVEIDQSESRQQPCVILLQAAIANFGVLEDALQDAKGPFDLALTPDLVRFL